QRLGRSSTLRWYRPPSALITRELAPTALVTWEDAANHDHPGGIRGRQLPAGAGSGPLQLRALAGPPPSPRADLGRGPGPGHGGGRGPGLGRGRGLERRRLPDLLPLRRRPRRARAGPGDGV